MNNTTTIDNSTVPSLDNSTVTLNNDTNNIVPPVDNNTTSVDNNTISTMDNNSNSTIISDGNNTNSTFVSFDKSSVFSFEEALKLHQKIKITKCEKDEDCPYTEICSHKQCIFSLTCSSDKLYCMDSNEYKDDTACNVNQECISSNCINNVCSSTIGIINCNLLGDQVNCGLPKKAACTQNSECLSNKCNGGTCDNVDTEVKYIFTKPVITFTCVMAVLILLCLCCCITICTFGRKNKKLVKTKKATPKKRINV